MRPGNGLIAALDIGTTKVVCFVARLSDDGTVAIQGIGHHLSQGVRSGIITDIRAAEHSIVSAVHAAEQMAGETIENVVVGLSGSRLTSHNLHVEVPLSSQSIGERDIQRVLEHGRHSLETSERRVIHCIPVSYVIDEARGIDDPRGMYGNRLGASLHLVTAPNSMVKNLTACINRCQLEVEEYVASAYASGIACLFEEEMDLGVTMLDIGGASTSVAVFVDGKLLYTDSVPVGGLHITSDIAKGLSTSSTSAERIKALYGNVVASPSDSQEVLDIPQIGEEEAAEAEPVARSMLVGIIRPRVEEILEMVREHLERSGFDKVSGRRIVLTGGGSQLMGIADLASRVFNKQVRLGRPKSVQGLAESTSSAAFSTAVGLLEYGARKARRNRVIGVEVAGGVKNKLGRVYRWVKENL